MSPRSHREHPTPAGITSEPTCRREAAANAVATCLLVVVSALFLKQARVP
jgi:hypothetical protein